jgi:hypothetical protein
VADLILVRSMTRNVTLAAVYLTLAASAHAQATTSEGSAKGAQLPRVYAMYAPKPDYPLGGPGAPH